MRAGPLTTGRVVRHRQERFWPPKISDTEESLKTASIASAMIGATESTSILSILLFGGSGSVFVTTTREIGAAASRSSAGSESTGWVAMAHTSVAPASTNRYAAAHTV